jgi:alkanesulfonate monooxygenase SsuD/methylene tetrahydromethanopterin reductase-like flavin-dependent oxidoreductase (luciferase family)
MDVSLTLDFRNPTRRPWRELWEDNLWLMREAEAMGFSQLFVQEHFFTSDGYGPSVPIFLTALAERTQTARLGSYLYILPLHNPVALAQETAVLDNLCGGRLDVVVGAGHRPLEFRAFNVSPKTRPSRMEEHLDLLTLAWSGEPFSYQGRYYDLADVEVQPAPLQKPHPPVWIGGTRPAAAARAGRRGFNLAAASAEPEFFDAYLSAREAAGYPRDTAQISKPWSITTTYEDPEVVWDRYADLHIERWSFYSKIRAEMGDPELTLQMGNETKPYRHNELIGSPEQIVEKLREAREKLPFTRLVTDATAGIPVREVTYPSLKLFADRVMPELASL